MFHVQGLGIEHLMSLFVKLGIFLSAVERCQYQSSTPLTALESCLGQTCQLRHTCKRGRSPGRSMGTQAGARIPEDHAQAPPGFPSNVA